MSSPSGLDQVFTIDCDAAARHHDRVARIVFTQQLRRFTETPEIDAPVPTLRAALDAAFAANPRLRGYVLANFGFGVAVHPDDAHLPPVDALRFG